MDANAALQNALEYEKVDQMMHHSKAENGDGTAHAAREEELEEDELVDYGADGEDGEMARHRSDGAPDFSGTPTRPAKNGQPSDHHHQQQQISTPRIDTSLAQPSLSALSGAQAAYSPMSDVNLNIQLATSASASASASGPAEYGDVDPGAHRFREYKDMLPTRRQNVACDACRARKVKCVRMPMAEQCEHCRSKGTPCTSIYVTQVTSSRKKTGKESSYGANGNGNGNIPHPAPNGGSAAAGAGLSMVEMNGAGVSPHITPGVDLASRMSETETGRPAKRARVGGPERNGDAAAAAAAAVAPEFDLSNLLLFMFSPTPVRHNYFGYTDRPRRPNEKCWPIAPNFDAAPTNAHLKLMAESMRMDLATDLVETYFQICHIRSPLLDPENFRRRFTNPHNPEGPPSASIIACVLAWGAKFSEHPLIVADRHDCSADLPAGRKRSRLAQMMTCRAQEVLETNKVFRTPSLENLQACLMMVALGGPGKYRFWHCASVELCLALGYNKRTVVTKELSAKERGPAGFAFWFTFWHDACASAIARDSPRMHDDDHDLEVSQFYEVNENHHPIGGLSKLQEWHSSVSSLCRVCRNLARGLFLPKCERLGVPLSTVKMIADSLQSWRTEYLAKVGVPTVWPESWDFVAAVTACSSDLTYHVLWVVLAQTLDESGIYELRQIERGDAFGSPVELQHTRMEVEAVRQKVNDEALHGALRISALASVLTTNSYLRLDPNVLFCSIREGGRYLAKMGRKEVQPCIAGLRQYGMSFEEAFDEVDHLQRIIADRQTACIPDMSIVRRSASPMASHHSSIPVHMSASPNSYSLSGMSNPPPSDFAFALANNQPLATEFPLPYQDNHQLFSYGDR